MGRGDGLEDHCRSCSSFGFTHHLPFRPRKNCILADEMGLGKTIQSITFLYEIFNMGIRGPFLIIAPLSTITNWEREFRTWTHMNVIVYHGSQISRQMILQYEMFYRDQQVIRRKRQHKCVSAQCSSKNSSEWSVKTFPAALPFVSFILVPGCRPPLWSPSRPQGNTIPSVLKFHGLITTFEMIMADCPELRKLHWRCVVIDEAHRLKNKNCKLLEGLKLMNLVSLCHFHDNVVVCFMRSKR